MVGASSSKPLFASLNPRCVGASAFESRKPRINATVSFLDIAERVRRRSSSCHLAVCTSGVILIKSQACWILLGASADWGTGWGGAGIVLGCETATVEGF